MIYDILPIHPSWKETGTLIKPVDNWQAKDMHNMMHDAFPSMNNWRHANANGFDNAIHFKDRPKAIEPQTFPTFESLFS